MAKVLLILVGQVIRYALLGFVLMVVFRIAGNELPFINAFVIAFIGDVVIQTLVALQEAHNKGIF